MTVQTPAERLNPIPEEILSMTFEQLNTAHASALDTGEIPSPATPEGDAISRELPNAFYECASCTNNGSEANCRPSDEIRLSPSGTWMCEYCYEDDYFDGEEQDQPSWADLPKLSAALRSLPPQDGAQCCMCGKKGLSTAEDGGPECELSDGRWVCSGACWQRASALTAQPVAQEPISGYCGCEPRITTHSLVTGRITCNHCAADLGSVATPAPVEAGLREAAQFLSDRLHQFDLTDDHEEMHRDFVGHVEPALARLDSALRAQSSPVVPVTPVTVGVDMAAGPDQKAVMLINPSQAALDILAERQRQISAEGWTPEHDDQHEDFTLALVAALYATPRPLYAVEFERNEVGQVSLFSFDDPWPSEWDDSWDKRLTHPRRRKLEIAGALILAEMERLDRITPPPASDNGEDMA